MKNILTVFTVAIMVSAGASAQFRMPRTIVPNDQMPKAHKDSAENPLNQ